MPGMFGRSHAVLLLTPNRIQKYCHATCLDSWSPNWDCNHKTLLGIALWPYWPCTQFGHCKRSFRQRELQLMKKGE
jgi:hypothetical protein